MSLPSFSTPFQGGEPSFEDEMCEMCPKLTYQQRLTGFAICCGFGYLLSFMGTIVLASEGASKDGISMFVMLYILGNFIALGATGFLIGPKTQCKKMCDKTRRFSTIFWLLTLIVTFAVAVAGVHIGIVFLMVFVQICASVWYSASYIPYGRRMIVKMFQSTCCAPCPGVCEPCIKIAT
mmetsp:Transcript_11223/g.33500  ORF Transcript_11223/g.33500 Transcript_11223/m.33500 type:complete len:179 (-) Transcript_11223:40-576(-)